MSKTVIAVPQMGDSLFRRYMKSKYAESVARAGGEVKWIDVSSPEKAADEALECLGLLLPGGADIAPSLYGEKRDDKCGKPNEPRDRAEPVMFTEFIKTGKPVLGICRGVQLMNVAFGGTLYQDIKEIQKYKHMSFATRARHIHSVILSENTKLISVFGENRINVNSMHHQAIKKVAPDFTQAAVSEDGFTEAIEMQNYGFCVGVQWHPEHMSKKSEKQQELFNVFVRECEKYDRK